MSAALQSLDSVLSLASLVPAGDRAIETVPTKVLTLPGYVEIIAVTTGALSGALHASSKRLDIMGVMVVAVCTGVGGGAIRDVILNNGIPVFLVSQSLLFNSLLAAVIGTLFAAVVKQLTPIMWVIDSLLIGVWVVIGVQKALLLDLSPVSAAFVGVVACTGGSLLRDILCRDQPEILRPGTFYAAAAAAGAGAYLALAALGGPVWTSIAATIIVAAGLRAASAYFGWETTRAPVSLGPWPAPTSQ